MIEGGSDEEKECCHVWFFIFCVVFSDELLLATTPYQRPESPEFMQGHGQGDPFDPNHLSIHAEEQLLEEEEEEEDDKKSDGTLEDE